MANTRVEDVGCGIPTLERNRYFYGKPMTVRDFEQEQLYLLQKSRFLNRQFYGAGLICGLQVSVPQNFDRAKPTVELTEGAALDCCGNLIVVSQSGKTEVKGIIQDGVNYLYISYDECVRQPVIASANVSSCGEVCCYNRVRETFEVTASTDPPYASIISGNVATDGMAGRGISGVKIEAIKKGSVRAATFSGETGNFTLNVTSAGSYDLRFTRRGFKTRTETMTLPKGTTSNLKFVLAPESGTTITGGEGGGIVKQQPVLSLPLKTDVALRAATVQSTSICAQMEAAYFDSHLRTCADDCEDARVFIGVLDVDKTTGAATFKADETVKYRRVVYSNPMLHELMCDHFNDFDNPHRTTAVQVGALRSINNVGNTAAESGIENINLASDGTVQIVPDQGGRKITLKTSPAASVTSVSAAKKPGTSKNYAPEDHTHDLAQNVVRREHLNKDFIAGLVTANETIIVTPDDDQKTIGLAVDPRIIARAGTDVSNVSSVVAAKQLGASARFAREDHAHDIADGVVKRKHFNSDVVQNLLVPDASILTSPNTANQTISISVNPSVLPRPATTVKNVKSVGPALAVGTSANYAREDHVHNLQINDCTPSTEGQFTLTAGNNILIEKVADHELRIAQREAPPPPASAINGLVTIRGVLPTERRLQEVPVPGGWRLFAVILAIQTVVEGHVTVRGGDYKQLTTFDPFLGWSYEIGAPFFWITLIDRRTSAPGTTPPPADYNVRWWVIPATELAASPPGGPASPLDV